MLLVPFVAATTVHSQILLREYLGFIEQKTQLFHEGIFAFLGGCTELLMPGKTQSFHERIYTAFKLRDTLALSLEFFIFRAGNGDHFCVAYLVIIRLFYINIIAYFF